MANSFYLCMSLQAIPSAIQIVQKHCFCNINAWVWEMFSLPITSSFLSIFNQTNIFVCFMMYTQGVRGSMQCACHLERACYGLKFWVRYFCFDSCWVENVFEVHENFFWRVEAQVADSLKLSTENSKKTYALIILLIFYAIQRWCWCFFNNPLKSSTLSCLKPNHVRIENLSSENSPFHIS